MLLTEEIAKTKNCCGPFNEKCIGTKCMAWRFSESLKLRKFKAAINNSNDCNFDFYACGDYWVETIESAEKRRLGFCGLAGKPGE